MKCVTLALRTVAAFFLAAFSLSGLMFNPNDLMVGLAGGTSLLALAEWLDTRHEFGFRKKRPTS